MTTLDGPQWVRIMGRMKAKDLVNLPSIKFKQPMSQVKGAILGHVEMSKEDEDGEALYDSIKKHGVQRPVTVSRYLDGSYELSDGHHRVASAMDINPEMDVPVYFGNTRG